MGWRTVGVKGREGAQAHGRTGARATELLVPRIEPVDRPGERFSRRPGEFFTQRGDPLGRRAGFAASVPVKVRALCDWFAGTCEFFAFEKILRPARSLQAEAEANQEVLSQFGLSEAVLEVYGQLLDQYDAAVKAGIEGRARHTGATRRLEALALEAGQLVRAMDARNRYRFKNDHQALGAWISASTVFGQPGGVGSAATPAPVPPVPGSSPVEGSRTPDAGGDVRPAA